MKKRKIARGPLALLLLGVLLTALALVPLLQTPAILQYVIASPQVTQAAAADSDTGAAAAATDTGLEPLMKAREKLAEALTGSVEGAACAALKSGAQIGRGDLSQTAGITAVGDGWFEVSPRYLKAGRFMDADEMKRGAYVALLDQELAFLLFGSEDPLGQTITVEETEYRVIGVTRHSRRTGEADAYSALIPMTAAARQGLQTDVCVMAARPLDGSGVDQAFETQMHTLWGEKGDFYSLKKETMRGLMLPRVLLALIGVALIVRLFRLLNGVSRGWHAAMQALRRHRYFKNWFPQSLARILLGMLGYAVLLAGAYLLLGFAIAPVYSFTEWVPETLVELTSLKTVFWNLADAQAELVRLGTPELRRLQFFSGILRWGCICLICAAAFFRARNKKVENKSENGNSEAGAGV